MAKKCSLNKVSNAIATSSDWLLREQSREEKQVKLLQRPWAESKKHRLHGTDYTNDETWECKSKSKSFPTSDKPILLLSNFSWASCKSRPYSLTKQRERYVELHYLVNIHPDWCNWIIFIFWTNQIFPSCPTAENIFICSPLQQIFQQMKNADFPELRRNQVSCFYQPKGGIKGFTSQVSAKVTDILHQMKENFKQRSQHPGLKEASERMSKNNWRRLQHQNLVSLWLFWEMQFNECREFSKVNPRLAQQYAFQFLIAVDHIFVAWILHIMDEKGISNKKVKE